MLSQMMTTLNTHPPLRIPRVNQYLPGLSYWNVMEHARTNGGYAVMGWNVAWSPGVLLSAIRHCVWMRQDGTLIDLTAANPADRGETTFLTLLDQASDVFDLRFPDSRSNYTQALMEDPQLVEADRLYQRWHSLNLKLTEMLKRMGWMWNPGNGWYGGTQAAAADMLGQQVLTAQQAFLDMNSLMYDKPPIP